MFFLTSYEWFRACCCVPCDDCRKRNKLYRLGSVRNFYGVCIFIFLRVFRVSVPLRYGMVWYGMVVPLVVDRGRGERNQLFIV